MPLLVTPSSQISDDKLAELPPVVLVGHLAWDVPYRALLDDEAPDVTATEIVRLLRLFASPSCCRDINCFNQNGIFQTK